MEMDIIDDLNKRFGIPGQMTFKGGPGGLTVAEINNEHATACVIHDPGLKRKIRIRKDGSKSTVIWNPWIDKARKLKDLGDEEYTSFICVETANAGDELITLAPGSGHRLRVNISIEPQ
jgi:D-hexose-6-phosphate mutarotase